MKTIRKTKSYVILSAAKHLFVSVMITVSASFAQQASTPPRGDKVPRHIRSLPGEFAIAPLSLSMDLARLEAELVGLGPSLAALAPASLAQLDAERAMVGVLSVAPLAPMAFIPPLEHLSVDLLRLDAELAQAPMHMLDAPFVHFDLPGDIDWGDGENPQQDPGYQTYKEGYNLILQEKWNEARTKLSEVARRFSSSRYVDDAQYWIAYSWMQAQPKKAAELYREFFKKYPTSNYFDDAVADLGRLEGQSAADSARSARAAYEAQSLAGRMKTPTAAVAPALPNDPKVAGATIIVPPGGRYLVEEQSGSPELRIKKDAIEALGRKPDEVALKTLQEIAMDQSQHRELRQSAMNALQRADRGKALELYISVAKSDPDEDVRKDAVYYIGQYARKDDERAFGILKDYAADSKQPPEVRESAMHALKETKKGDVLNLYVQLAKSDPDTRIKKTALY
ncbi:MAG TPA: HEAT repeat domain-containing protein, partial [Bacteroidota bacterium]